MSILIKGMEMPKSCEYCDLCTSDGDCIATGGDSLWDALPEGAEYFPTGWKYEGCPLVEVPVPHGRLIDADALLEDVRKNSVSYSADDFAHEWVDVQPTVIEAEDGGAE